MTERFRPGSRIAQMWAKFEKEGPEAAIAFGPSLNLAASTISNWVRGWSREAGKQLPVEAKKTSVAAAKSNIKVVWTKRPVRLVERGEQCSEVRWLDTGTQQTLTNDQIQF